MAADARTLSVVIAHFRGDVLQTCLASLREKTRGAAMEIIVVDDGVGNDGSVARAKERFPEIRLARTAGRRGYGAACNAGLAASRGEFVFFLNNDAAVSDGWLAPLLEAADRHPDAGFFQPKIVSARDPERFPPGGGCGGGIDLLAYPFTRGSFIFTQEADAGQYDAAGDVFWPNGAALFARRSALERTGAFDEDFYMQMEDVDLGWRAHLMGIGVRSVPASVIFHYGGWTLGADTLQRYYLSHRNSLILLLKNPSLASLLVLLPARLAVEAGGALAALLLMGNWRLSLGSALGLVWIGAHLPAILRRRARAQAGRTRTDGYVYAHVHRGSILAAYLFRGVRTAQQLRDRRGGGAGRALSDPPRVRISG